MKIEEITLAEYKAHFINIIKHKYKSLRQQSKTVTFALQYQGTAHTLMENSGFSKEEATSIVHRYHTIYHISRIYASDKLKEAANTGYITAAFGLRLRTPILKQTLLNKKSTPYEAQAEGRTAGNALSQSYGLLNNRAANEFMDRVHNSKYKYDIRLVALIHDASYYIVKNNIGAIKFINDNLTECMSWQEAEEIKHDKVKLSGELDIFLNGWHQPITLPNNISKYKILNKCTT